MERLISRIKDYALGYKLPGAGGGGYLYIVAKDPEASLQIRRLLTADPQNDNARFVEMSLSDKGLQVSRSNPNRNPDSGLRFSDYVSDLGDGELAYSLMIRYPHPPMKARKMNATKISNFLGEEALRGTVAGSIMV